MIDIPHESKTRISDYFGSPGEPTIRHVILHDVDGVRIFDPCPANFVECDHIPKPDQANLSPLIIVKERRRARLATTEQGHIRREFTEDIGLTGAARAKLDEVVVGFDKRK